MKGIRCINFRPEENVFGEREDFQDCGQILVSDLKKGFLLKVKTWQFLMNETWLWIILIFDLSRD